MPQALTSTTVRHADRWVAVEQGVEYPPEFAVNFPALFNTRPDVEMASVRKPRKPKGVN